MLWYSFELEHVGKSLKKSGLQKANTGVLQIIGRAMYTQGGLMGFTRHISAYKGAGWMK